MEPFFNDTFKPETINKSWKLRSLSLQLQPYNDALFKRIHDDVILHRATFFERLKTAAENISSPHERPSISIWGFAEMRFDKFLDDYAEQLEEARRRGFDTTIMNLQGTHDMSVGRVVRNTDILPRLSLMFGPDYSVHVRTISECNFEDLYGGDEVRRDKDDAAAPMRYGRMLERDIIVVYNPPGTMGDYMRARKAAAAIKYGEETPCQAPRTPPRVMRLSSPPPAPKRR